MTKIHNTLSLPANDASQRQKFSSKLSHVYVLQDEAGVIKIGHSANPAQRIKQIQRCCGLYIVRQHISPPCYNYRQIETALLTQFLNQTRQSEHLQTTNFEEVCLALDKQEFQTEQGNAEPFNFLLFLFGTLPIRVFLDEKGNLWFVAKDVCQALGIVWNGSNTLASIPKEWRVVWNFHTTQKNQYGINGESVKELILINEPALYKLMFRSYKKETAIFNPMALDLRLDTELLLCHVLGITRSHLLAWPNPSLSSSQQAHFQQLLARRLQGEPLAYLIGYKAFWTLELQVTPATLIPRPETELLVEQALARLPVAVPQHIFDLGTGSGAIALALAQERPACQVLAIDFDNETLTVAQNNARHWGINNVQFLCSDWFTALGKKQAHLIVSNPPYIAENDLHLQGDGVRYEPQQALVSGRDGLTALRHLIADAPIYLQDRGWLLLEHGYDQKDTVCQLFTQHHYTAITTYTDLAGQPRVTAAQKSL